MPKLTILGEHPLAVGPGGKLKNRVATIFPRTGTLVALPGIHATQRMGYTDWLNQQRQQRGEAPLTEEEQWAVWEQGVDLIVDGQFIQIRPNPSDMSLAFEADRLLQEGLHLSKRNVRFLYARQDAVQQAIREHGEYWRIAPLPQSPDEIIQMIARSRIAIGGDPIYYYSMVTGTHYLTVQEAAALGAKGEGVLRLHAREIAEYASRYNRMGNPELDFFAVSERPSLDVLAGCDWAAADAAEVRDRYRVFLESFRRAVPPDLRDDALANLPWRNRMFSCLIGQHDQTISEEVLPGVTPEFFLQIRWLPGGCIEHGELVFDTVFSEAETAPSGDEVRALCDARVKGFIFNYVREFGNLEYVNIGQVAPALRRRTRSGGHCAYIAEVKHRGSKEPVVRIIRLQKWGIREHLDEGKDLLQSIMEAEDYTEFILDRRLGCWQLGMHLLGRILTRRIHETYDGMASRFHGTRLWATYFERDYIDGMATDKIPAARYGDSRFAVALARLLGRAAAPNMVVGRATLEGRVIFDDGDEILIMDHNGIPADLIAADHAGTFNDCSSPLKRFAAGYAQPVRSRRALLADGDAFTAAYLGALSDGLVNLQQEYGRQQRAFDHLFKHSKQDVGSFSWRWIKVLQRLRDTNVPELVERIRAACAAP